MLPVKTHPTAATVHLSTHVAPCASTVLIYSNRLWLSLTPRTRSTATAPLPSMPVLSLFLLSSSLHPHQTLSRSLSKQTRSKEPGVSEDGHAARELKQYEDCQAPASHFPLLASPYDSVTSKGAPQSAIAASDFLVTRGEEERVEGSSTKVTASQWP